MSQAPVIEVGELNVWLPPIDAGPQLHIVRDVSFTLARGERLGLVGESGCGKSTTVLSLVGLLPERARLGGRITFDGEDLLGGGASGTAGLATHRGRGIAVVMQSAMHSLNPVQRIERQIVEAMPPAARTTRAAARERCAELLELVKLPARTARAYPHELSGGMRQRVGIATALAADPKVVIADEPTTALDTVVQAQIVELLDELCEQLDLAVILVTHHLALAAQFCDTLAVMYAGRIVERGASADLAAAASHPYARLLFAASPGLDSRKEDVVSIPGAPPSLAEPDRGCAFGSRCPECFAPCADELPLLAAAGHAGAVACHLPSAHGAGDA